MGLFDDVSRFLETQLEEFLKSHPHLELQALLEQLEEQERDTLKLINSLESDRKRLETQILDLAQDIQTWHSRIGKAEAANRPDLAKAAQEREASLFRQGNQVWGKMEGVKKRIAQAQELLNQIQPRKKELGIKVEEAKKQKNVDWETTYWDQPQEYRQTKRASDSLDVEFKEWETEQELNQLKQNLGK
ncbi:MAG: hypothetical protein N5P05_000746 [Chroococcopsis gigantea SAG 12.99]|jgi:uncharacterized protein (TIGR04376 family)|nr:TIGR04376 family protein [Chlorogloea purpurea SAG 13.99]MDV2999140.1 hypothetical protein [Chroococcopsis gigantea SAG 12.99]